MPPSASCAGRASSRSPRFSESTHKITPQRSLSLLLHHLPPPTHKPWYDRYSLSCALSYGGILHTTARLARPGQLCHSGMWEDCADEPRLTAAIRGAATPLPAGGRG